MIIEYGLVVVIGYLIGAIPWGFIVGKIQGIDVRRYGSGKTGATNTLRTLGTRSSVVVFLCDMGKGVAVVLLARYLFHSTTAEVVAALAATVGHNWSVYIGFFGGRGVTISFGSTLAMYWPATIFGLIVFAAVIGLTRYVSLASIVGTVCTVLAILALSWLGVMPLEYAVYSLIGGPLVVFAHLDNIRRLRTGRERRLGEQAEATGN